MTNLIASMLVSCCTTVVTNWEPMLFQARVTDEIFSRLEQLSPPSEMPEVYQNGSVEEETTYVLTDGCVETDEKFIDVVTREGYRVNGELVWNYKYWHSTVPEKSKILYGDQSKKYHVCRRGE